MRVVVKLFASFAAWAGFRVREMEIPDGSSARDLLTILRKGPLTPLPTVGRPLFAVNRQHVSPDHVLHEADEVSIFPPVSGGLPPPEEPPLIVTSEILPVKRLADSVRHASCGAVVVFEGTVRDHNEGQPVASVDYEAHAEMALDLLDAIRREVLARWPSARLAMAHRTGLMAVGETSVVVACAAPHRREAFAACRMAMDRVKESLPVWKREESPSGFSRWL